jgi:tripartite ATP-independent transporter DctP family solute receptor
MHKAAIEAAEAFKGCTQGRHTITVYPASQLGSESAMNQQLRLGGVEIILTGQTFIYTIYKPMGIAAAPFIFNDRDQALRYRTSPLFKELWLGYQKETGQQVMSAGYFGAFNLTSNRPIEKPEDARGLKIRVPDARIYNAFPRAVGANPTPITLAEVYLALQQGTVDGSANPLPITYAFKFYEVQKYVNPTGHMHEYALWVANGQTVSQLGEEDRGCLQKAADVYGDRSTALILELEQNLRGKMEGEKLISFSNPDIPAFQRATANIVEELAKEMGISREFLDKLRAI